MHYLFVTSLFFCEIMVWVGSFFAFFYFTHDNFTMSKLNAVPFDKKEYWEERFEKEKHFEWLMTWEDIKEVITPYLGKNEYILNLGKSKVFSKYIY